jgi:hypothetical protein
MFFYLYFLLLFYCVLIGSIKMILNKKSKLAALALSVAIINFPALFSGTGNLELNVDGTNTSNFSGPITASTVKKTDAGSLILSHPNNDIDTLEINGGEVVISTPSNINSTSTVVKFNASGTDPVTSEVNTAKLRITEDMNTGLLNFSTDGEVEVDSSKTATWNVVPTGTGHCKKTGNGTLEIDSDLGPQDVSSSFNTTSGFFESGTNQLAWPSAFLYWIPLSTPGVNGNPNWRTSHTSNQNISYGGVLLNFAYNGTLGFNVYWRQATTILAAHPIITIPTSIAGIDIDGGTLYVHGGTAPDAPISISSIARLKIAGNADTEVGGDITIQTGGNIEVEENVKVGNALSTITIYTFDTVDGYYKSGSEILPWPSNFKIFYNNPTGSTPEWSYWSTNDTSDQVIFYGGVRLEFLNSGWIGSYAYRNLDSTLSAAHPTTTASTGMDAGLSGSVFMESGAKIDLKANSTWAHDITVTPVI